MAEVQSVLRAFNAELRTINETLHSHQAALNEIKTGLELLNKIAGRLEEQLIILNNDGCARACNTPPPEITPVAVPRRQLRGTRG